MGQARGPDNPPGANPLPWAIAVGALIVFALTLNHWVSLLNLLPVSQIAGWNWQSGPSSPVFYVVTYPFRWLPVSWIPLALNLFSAACAALTLGLLAQSVLLLPHDRSEDQRLRERSDFSLLTIRQAWLPAVLSAVICGLQLSFWERATNCSAEMFDLLLFAYVVRSLLRYRIGEHEPCLARAALVYGMAMTEHWAMVGLLPAFIAVVFWIRGTAFFNSRFLARMAVCGLAGMSFYFLLPAIIAASGEVGQGFWPTFWQGLKYGLQTQWMPLRTLAFNPEARHILGLLSLISLLPAAFMGIRWASSFGDNSPMGAALAGFLFNLVHVIFLAVCVWVALDPSVSPRRMGLGVLYFYYVGALSAGYYSGYLLLVFGKEPARQQRTPTWAPLVNRAVVAWVWLLLFLAPAGLLYENLPQILATNGDMVQRYASRLEQGLPRGKAVLLSDDWRSLFLLEASLVRHGKARDYLMVHTQSLKWPAYHQFLHRIDPKRWPALTTTQPTVTEGQLLRLMIAAAANSPICYLQPSFGYYFEYFCPEPHGLAVHLNACPTNSLIPAAPTPDVVRENQSFWAQAGGDLSRLIGLAARKQSAKGSLTDWLMSRARVIPEGNFTAQTLAGYYSHSLTCWGNSLQQLGDMDAAAKCFETAIKLKPDNVVAQVNLDFNARLRAGNRTPQPLSKSVEDRFGRYRNWNALARENGVFDEPNLCYEQGRVYYRNSLMRQAAAEFARACELSDSALARIWLARLDLAARKPGDALRVLKDFQDRPADFSLNTTNRSELLFAEASALYEQDDARKAGQVIAQTLKENPGNNSLLAAALLVYESHGDYSNALAVVDRRLQLDPDNAVLLMNRAGLCARLGLKEGTIAALTRVVALQTNNYLALCSRADAYALNHRPEAARQDYSAALQILNRVLNKAPTNQTVLMTKGVVSLNLGAYDEAADTFTRLLLQQSNNPNALINRALAYLRGDRLDKARADYQRIESIYPKEPAFQYQLAQIADRKKDTNAAVVHYQKFLDNAGANSPERAAVSQRLKELKGAVH